MSLDNYKLSCELFGHQMDVRSVATAFSEADGELIVSGSRDKTAKIWRHNGTSFLEKVTLQDHKNFVSCVAYLKREGWICTGSVDSTVCIYNENSVMPFTVLKGHKNTVSSIYSGLKPMSLITGSWDTTARVWSIDSTGSFSFIELSGHELAVWAVTSLPPHQNYVTASADKTIIYWSLAGEKLRTLKGHTDVVRDLVFLDELNILVSCANDSSIRCWNEAGECIKEITGHTNYIYSVVRNKAIGKEVIVTCGEDSTLRMWNAKDGTPLGEPIYLPTQSVWSVACLQNGDIVSGSSDGVVRIFTADPNRTATSGVVAEFNNAVQKMKDQSAEYLGDIRKVDLPGPESLLKNGTKEGQTKMVRHSDGSIKCYSWQQGEWSLIGDVTGSAKEQKTLYQGKEYDFVFSVDISDDSPPLKLPYNRSEDPWKVAQDFINLNNLPQVYLDQVHDFIIKNSSTSNSSFDPQSASSCPDPFTGGSRYLPGSNANNFQYNGNVDPFTGASSYSSYQAAKNMDAKQGSVHFPVLIYTSFDNADLAKVLMKLKEFNKREDNSGNKISDASLDAIIKMAEISQVDIAAIQNLESLLQWPNDIIFPVLDVVRMIVRNEDFCIVLNRFDFIDRILPKLKTTVANQLMIVRCLVNVLQHNTGRTIVEHRLPQIVSLLSEIRQGSPNLQIAIASFYLNLAVSKIWIVASEEKCGIVSDNIIALFDWITDPEASYRTLQAIGTMIKTPFGQVTMLKIVSSEPVLEKIRDFTNATQSGNHEKLASAGKALLDAF